MKKFSFVAPLFFLLSALASFNLAEENNTITVSNARELFAAIGPDRTIICTPGDYHIITARGVSSDYVTWSSYFAEPEIRHVENLTITATADIEILNEREAGYVLILNDCKNISLQHLIFGHVGGQHDCNGGVIKIFSSRDITIKDCTLFGSGLTGLRIVKSIGITIEKSTVKECTFDIMSIFEGSSVKVLNCSLFGTKPESAYPLISCRQSSDILFSECIVSNNSTAGDFFFCDAFTNSVSLTKCRFIGNSYRSFAGTGNSPQIIKCTIKDRAINKKRSK